jgi:hypothetical protein
MAAKPDDAIALLKADHRKVEDLFEQFESTSRASKQQRLASQICTELIVHSTIEEEVFYPALRGKIEDDTLDEAYVEHDGAKVLIAQILGATPGDDFYEARVTVLSEAIKHHVREEERGRESMFAQARSTDVDLAALGASLTARKKELLAQIKASGLPAPVTRTLKPAQLELGQPV